MYSIRVHVVLMIGVYFTLLYVSEHSYQYNLLAGERLVLLEYIPGNYSYVISNEA
jgi:hypothetical protein